MNYRVHESDKKWTTEYKKVRSFEMDGETVQVQMTHYLECLKNLKFIYEKAHAKKRYKST